MFGVDQRSHRRSQRCRRASQVGTGALRRGDAARRGRCRSARRAPIRPWRRHRRRPAAASRSLDSLPAARMSPTSRASPWSSSALVVGETSASESTRRARSTATSTSSSPHRHTGTPATTRGAGRPAASAAALIVGAMWVPIARSSASQRIVPSVRSPARRSIFGPERGDHHRRRRDVGDVERVAHREQRRCRPRRGPGRPAPGRARRGRPAWSAPAARRAGRASRRSPSGARRRDRASAGLRTPPGWTAPAGRGRSGGGAGPARPRSRSRCGRCRRRRGRRRSGRRSRRGSAGSTPTVSPASSAQRASARRRSTLVGTALVRDRPSLRSACHCPLPAS